MNYLTEHAPLIFDQFASHIEAILGNNLRSILLFGSYVLNDFTEGQGDLDFMVLTTYNLDAKAIQGIFQFHEALRAGALGVLGAQLEGTYYPLSLVMAPLSGEGKGCYIGTRREGWRSLSRNVNSLMDYAMLSRVGQVIHGEDLRAFLYVPTPSELIQEMHDASRHHQTFLEKPELPPGFAVSLVHWITRNLIYLATHQIVSKTKAGIWYCAEYSPAIHQDLVQYCLPLRHPYSDEAIAHAFPELRSRIQELLTLLNNELSTALFE